METAEALTRFLKKGEERGLALATRRKYHYYLRHFQREHPQLPQDTHTIEEFLRKRKETPAHRGDMFKCIQAFYAYLEEYEGIKSPVPPKGKVGRPLKARVEISSQPLDIGPVSTLHKEKLVKGGLSASTYTSISTTDVINRYIAFKRAEGISPRTEGEYHGKLGAFAKAFPTLPLDPDQIANFLSSLKLDPITRWDYRKRIIALYHFLEKRGIIPKITDSFPRIKVPRKVRRVLSAEELGALFAHATNHQDKAILTLLIDAKIRASELCSLTRDNLHPDYIVVTGKTGERNVPIRQQTYDMLIHLATHGPLFRVEGRPMKREYLRVHLRKLMQKAGLNGKRLGPHILRHSASVQHIMFGGDLLSLKEELGHTTTRMTEQYAQLAFPEVRQRHAEVDVVGHIAPKPQLTRGICFGCGYEIKVELKDAKITPCPRCKQVGKWYLPDVRSEEMKEVK